jgi:hypothetical protein
MAMRGAWSAILVVLLHPGIPAGLRAQEALSPPPPRPEGVTPAAERAIERGLRYLAQLQRRDGAWEPESRYQSQGTYLVSSTGLAGLAFLAHGDTPTRGEYADVVRKATEFLISSSTSVGLIASSGSLNPNPDRSDDERTMYGHAFAMTFLAQVFGQEGDAGRREKIRQVLHKGIHLTRSSQTDAGGWAYFPNYYYDEGTLTVTQLQALRACRDAGLIVPKDIIEKGVGFIAASSKPDGSVRYRVNDSRWRPGVTCAAVVALWNAGQYDSDLIRRTIDFVNRNIEHDFVREHHAEYVEYYLAQAKWIMGDREWTDYYKKASSSFIQMQEPDGHWEGSDQYQYGTTFGTAIALIVLQLPYNRLPVYQR